METDEKRHGGKEAAALSGGHLCHVCGYQYPNPHPSAKLRRSHRKHCGKALPPTAEAVAEVEEAVAGEREEGVGDRNAAGRMVLGEEGGRQREEIGTSEANGGGAALRGSAGEVDSCVEDKVVAEEHSSPTCTGAQVIATELNENRLINCGSSENVFLEDTGAQIDVSELSENGRVDCSSNSIEIVNEGSGTELLIACTNGSHNIVGHPAEREDSFDEYQDASPFLHQSDSEDGTAPSSVFSTEMNNLNAISAGSSVTTNANSLETNGLLKDQFSGELNMTDLSADSKVGLALEEGALRLAEHEVNLKLGGPYEQAVNVDYTYTDMVDSKSDEASVHSEMIGCLNASSLQETRLVILEPESESTCSRKVEGFMEDRMHVLHTMPEASPRSEVVGSDDVQLETITNPSTNPMSIGSDLNVVCTYNTATDCSMELPRQNWSVEDLPDDIQPVENSSKKTLRCSTAGFQDDLPVTKMDDTPVTNVDDVEFTFEERPQTDTVEENLSIQKSNGFTKEEVCNKQIDPEIPTEDQFSTSQKHDTLLMDEASSVKNPFNLDDDRNDDLFELPTESCFSEVPNAVESRQVDSTSLMVDQPTVSNQTRMAEVQQCHNSNERILSASSASENGEVVGPEVIPVSSSSELVNKTCLTDHGLQENGHTSGDIFVPSQAASTELSTISMRDISALSEVEEMMQTEDASAEDMTAVRSIDCIEMKQAINTTANDTYAANVEEKKPIEGTAAGMNEVRQTDYVEEQTQASDTKELSTVQSIGNFEENKQTEGTDAKETNAWFNANDVGHKTQTAKEMAAAESTCSVEEKQQLNIMVGQDGSNNKLNEEIASTGAKLNSGRVRVPLKVLLAEASMENQVKKPSTKERVLSFRRRVTKDSDLSVKSGSPKSGSDDHHWSSPAKLPHKDVDKRSSKEKKQPWMPFICCHSVR
ncbi:unnamed protein product [Miscanthus lutarioriparius]|uniref:Uncharacterized protein n=1 Tax=Miscanthus lutarioriparius TaxID=422564 RepID=A0A811NNF2_9POAL|nr:unnamed protein product [Miscanthus lutarioriparius]